jgi:LPS-assembly protein
VKYALPTVPKFPFSMTWRAAPFRNKRLQHMVALALAAASVPPFVFAQSTGKAPRPNEDNVPTSLGAERMTGRPDREVILERDAEITRGQTTLNSDRATYNIIDDEVHAIGKVRLKRFGDFYTGDEIKLKLDTGKGFVVNPTYRLQQNNAQGKGERIDFEARDRATVKEGTYSTCEGPDPDWYLRSDTLKLDTGRDIGTASKTIVYFKGVPILGTPFMSFPLSNERKSGFLPPTVGTTNKGGLEVMLPYYFNIAPNRDLTLYPKVISQRGLQLGAHARYLGETYSGETKVEGLLHDRLTNSHRWAISTTHGQRFGNNWTFSTDLNAASDDNYPNDFPTTLTSATQRLLLRDMNLSYGGPFWVANARASNYQVLQDPLAPIGRPYDRLPQLSINAGQQDVNGFDWSAYSEFTRFWHPTSLRGNRMVINPRLTYPIGTSGYFIRPSVSAHATSYALSNPAPGMPSTFNRFLPTLSVDGGLVFERSTSFLGREATQTLEPRLFYVYTPYKDQTQYPIFDTGLADFNFSQIFSENRFSGYDRVSDANQLTAAVTTRFIEQSGAERMQFALAQRFYFNDQRVAAQFTGTANETRSDLLAAASGQVTSALWLDAYTQYSQSLRTVSRSNYGVRYQPGAKKILNLQYRRDLPAQLELVDLSGQWPVADRWYAVGRVNYSTREKKVAESLLGLEYKADCWVFRVVAHRLPTATGVATSSIFFQLELNGLSKLGSNPLDLLRTSIPGYQLVNQ